MAIDDTGTVFEDSSTSYISTATTNNVEIDLKDTDSVNICTFSTNNTENVL
jgi:hypothetical protein